MRKLVSLFIMIMAMAICEMPYAQNVCGKKKILKKTSKEKHRCIFIEYKEKKPGIKALFYIPVGKKDTFHYAVQDNDSIFLWAIVRGNKVRLIKDF